MYIYIYCDHISQGASPIVSQVALYHSSIARAFGYGKYIEYNYLQLIGANTNI